MLQNGNQNFADRCCSYLSNSSLSLLVLEPYLIGTSYYDGFYLVPLMIFQKKSTKSSPSALGDFRKTVVNTSVGF